MIDIDTILQKIESLKTKFVSSRKVSDISRIDHDVIFNEIGLEMSNNDISNSDKRFGDYQLVTQINHSTNKTEKVYIMKMELFKSIFTGLKTRMLSLFERTIDGIGDSGSHIKNLISPIVTEHMEFLNIKEILKKGRDAVPQLNLMISNLARSIGSIQTTIETLKTELLGLGNKCIKLVLKGVCAILNPIVGILGYIFNLFVPKLISSVTAGIGLMIDKILSMPKRDLDRNKTIKATIIALEDTRKLQEGFLEEAIVLKTSKKLEDS